MIAMVRGRALTCEEWVAQFRDRWDRWSARLATLQPDDKDGVVGGVALRETWQDVTPIHQLVLKSQYQPWRVMACTQLWDEAFSGLAVVVQDCKRLQLVQQGTAVSRVVAPDSIDMRRLAANESVRALRCPLLCLQQCPLEYLRSMSSAQQQQLKALSEFFLAAGPRLLLDTLAWERRNKPQDTINHLQQLAIELQIGVRELLQPPLIPLLELRSVKASLGRWLDALETATADGSVTVCAGCPLFDVHSPTSPSQDGSSVDPRMLLLEVAAAKPSRAALAFRHYADGGVRRLNSNLVAALYEDEGEDLGFCPSKLRTSCLDCIWQLNSSFKAGVLSEAVGVDKGVLGSVCNALIELNERLERLIRWPTPKVDISVVGSLLASWARAWEACSGIELKQHASLQYITQLLSTAASMVRIAAMLGRRQQGDRASVECLPVVQSALWTAASRLAEQAPSYLAALVNPELASGPVDTQAVFAAWRQAHSLLGDANAAWQWCHSSSGGAACEPGIDPRKEVQQLITAVGMALSMLQVKLLDPDRLEPAPLHSSAAFRGVVALALQVQVNATQALEVGSWDGHEGEMALHLSFCLAYTLKMASNASPSRTCGESAADGQHGLPRGGPYLHAIAAVRTLLRMAKQPLSDEFRTLIFRRTADVLCWLLVHKGTSALHAGAGRLLMDCCTDLLELPGVLKQLRAGGTDAAALGVISLLGAVGQSLSGRQQRQRDMQRERQLSMDAGSLLKRCCILVDAAAGTSFAAIDAGIEAEGAQLMRDLIGQGQPGAADAVRAYVWERRGALVLPRLELVVQRGLQVMVSAGTEHGSGSGSGSDGSGSGASGSSSDSSGCSGGCAGRGQVPLCPWVAVARELEVAAGRRACSRPTCCNLLVDLDRKLLVCQGCQVARYCSASCAQADWQRHRPVCRAIRALERREGCEEAETGQAGSS